MKNHKYLPFNDKIKAWPGLLLQYNVMAENSDTKGHTLSNQGMLLHCDTMVTSMLDTDHVNIEELYYYSQVLKKLDV